MNINYLMTAIFAIAIGFFVYNSCRRLSFLWTAKKEYRFDKIWQRIKSVLVFVFGQKRLFKDPFSGTLHFFVFWGFIILSSGAISGIGKLLFNYDALQFLGQFAKNYSYMLAFIEIIVAIAIIFLFYRRLIVKPKRLTFNLDGLICLSFILSLMLTGIPSRLMPYAEWSRDLEYLHFFLFLGFLNYLPFSKHFHLITALPNIFFRSLERGSKIPAMDMEDESVWEIETQKDFLKKQTTWKGQLDLVTCTECGRCEESCPASASGKPLSPKKIIHDLHKNSIIAPEELWGCATCGACEKNCPVFIEHISKIVNGRRFETMINGNVPKELLLSLNNTIDAEGTIKYGNPYGGSKESREDWIGDLPIKKIYENKDCDILFWVGCNGASNDRIQKITKKFAEILLDAHIHFGILGKEELCCGEWIRRIGNEYLYQSIVEKNIETLKKYNVKQIVTFCPHCFNTLKNEYAQFGGNFEVLHHTQFMCERKLVPYLSTNFTKRKKVVFHDPCYLGRHNGIYDEPRTILRSRLEVNLKKIKQSGENSFCCGGGGGQAFMEEHSEQKINEMRLNQLLEAKPDVIATSCPFCLTMLDNALKAKNVEGVEIKDIIEI